MAFESANEAHAHLGDSWRRSMSNGLGYELDGRGWGEKGGMSGVWTYIQALSGTHDVESHRARRTDLHNRSTLLLPCQRRPSRSVAPGILFVHPPMCFGIRMFWIPRPSATMLRPRSYQVLELGRFVDWPAELVAEAIALIRS